MCLIIFLKRFCPAVAPIGYIEDLNRVDVNDLKNFFLRWYGPNNATNTKVVLVGDITQNEILPKLAFLNKQ